MKTIIIADENSTVRNLVRLMFTECMGYRVVAASSGADAVLKARAIKPDVVLADVSLHDKDGYEVSRGIKNDPLLKNTYVILLAASLETFDARRAAEVRADDFIIKPFEPNQIIKKLEFLTTPREEHSRSLVIRTPERKNLPFDRVTMLLATFILIIPILYKSIDFSLYEPNSKTTADSGVGVKRIVSEAKKAPVEKTGFVRRDVFPSKLKYQNDEKAYTVGLRQFIEEETLKDKDTNRSERRRNS
jgi:Response regulator containing a CheY-like receiver domain and a GGDEF domain